MKALGNPFQGGIAELVNIQLGVCASEEVAKAMESVESVGQNWYKNFVKNVIEDRTVSIHATIKNRLPLFKCQKPKAKARSKQKESALRSDCNLFSCPVDIHTASKWESWRIFYARKSTLSVISLRDWKLEAPEDVRPPDVY